ncbi:hypothetical protein [Acidovorax sp. Root70]|uniref:hypothetical protein n=1 Tax=Acidovorax sp. Root70 TaxID=1736590 RepID=UPI0006F8DA1F|nr:hypothetical protein [Acidovorax sp. Root70]KRB30396.1 hypothetical protein ASD94_04210 [Acidovorax sp. Root70]
MFFKKLAATALLMGAGLVHAFSPQAGTWVVTSEVDGKPGRGFGIDVQNTTLVMQMYAYENSGQSTFYLVVGDVVDNKVTAPLTKYTGGRYFGSGARSGAAAGSPGNVSIRFTSGTTGFITFPNEGEVAISRFNFGYPFAPSSLKGIWNFTSMGSLGLTTEAVNLTVSGSSTSTGNGVVASSDGLFGCEHQVSGSMAGTVLCAKINAQGQLQRGYWFAYSVNEGEGRMLNSSAALTDQLVSIRRLTTPSGIGTGIVFKDSEQTAPTLTELERQLSQLAAQGAPD